MLAEIKIEQVLQQSDYVLIDVRSEKEYQEDTIPGAVNMPILNDTEKMQVGNVYREKSPTQAKRFGFSLIAERLPAMIEQYQTMIPVGKKAVLFCWRGGMRSQFTGQLLDMMGFDVYRIIGGYKAYRRYVNAYLEGTLPHKAVVLHGLTGVGKTEILHHLIQEGIPVLNLEELAKHRGSVFGKIGMPPSPSQKEFETGIVNALKKAESKGIFVVECESKRLGRLLVPQCVMDTMKTGYTILLYASLQNRVERSLREYVIDSDDFVSLLLHAVAALKKFLGKTKVEQLEQLLASGLYREAVEMLLVQYYDPLYQYPDKADAAYSLSVDTGNIEEAVKTIKQYIRQLGEFGISVSRGVEFGDWQNAGGSPKK